MSWANSILLTNTCSVRGVDVKADSTAIANKGVLCVSAVIAVGTRERLSIQALIHQTPLVVGQNMLTSRTFTLVLSKHSMAGAKLALAGAKIRALVQFQLSLDDL